MNMVQISFSLERLWLISQRGPFGIKFQLWHHGSFLGKGNAPVIAQTRNNGKLVNLDRACRSNINPDLSPSFGTRDLHRDSRVMGGGGGLVPLGDTDDLCVFFLLSEGKHRPCC